MGKIRKGDSSRLSKSIKKAAATITDRKAKTNESQEPARSTDQVETSKRKTTKALEKNSTETPSSPVASQRVARKQADTASGVTGGSSAFDQAEAEEKGDEADHLVDNPVEEEQRTDVRPPEGFQPGSPIQPPPDLSGQRPTETRELPTGGTQETFEKDGVTYTQTTRPGGVVDTSYEVDGVDYNSTQYEDGRSSTRVSSDRDDGYHTRTVESNAQGQVQSDTTDSIHTETDPQTGKITQQTRRESLGPDQTRTITEEVRRPDGGRANVTRTEKPDGRVEEVYEYTGDQGTLNRTTSQAADGSAQTTTERTYTSDQPLEELVDAPPIPDHAEGVVPLPENDRRDTQVREFSVVTTDPGGHEQIQHEETSYSQTSGDVRLNGSNELDRQTDGDTFPRGITPDNADSSLTHTVTTVRTRDEDGNMITTTGASQSLTLAGDRHEIHGGGDVSVTRTDTWNSAGESSSNFASKGFQESELLELSRGSDEFITQFSATAGGEFVSAGFPDIGKPPYQHYVDKGSGELEGWFGLDGSDTLDLNITEDRNADGEVVNEATTFSTVGENGEGKTATRTHKEDGAVGWTYTNFENGGRDYQRQTVFEGTDISIYEAQTTHGPGEFTRTSETKEGDEVVATSEASRREVNEEQLRQSVLDGELDQAQLDRLLTDGPPYFTERYNEHADALVDDDGNLREDENGDPIQAGHDVSSHTISNDDGYAVSEHYRLDEGVDGAAYDSRMNTVTDPSADPDADPPQYPVMGQVVKRERDPDTGQFRVTHDEELQVRRNGALFYGGEEVGEFDFGGSDLSTLMREGEGVTAADLAGLAGGAADIGAEVSGVSGGRFRFTGETGALSKFSSAADVFGLAAGLQGLYGGITEGDGRAFVEGLGDVAGGLNSLAAATAAIGGSTRLGTAATRLSTLTAGGTALGGVLGGAGGAISLGFGLYDVFTAESGYDQAAGGLEAAAGAVAIGSLFFGPPGWVVGGLLSGGLGIASIIVGGGDDNDTADIDSRLG
jgi:hypothetical protein